MKTGFVVLLTFLGTMTAFCAHQFDAAEWREVQTYDIQALQKIQGTLIGKIVGVRFQHRNDWISHRKPNWYESSIWSPNLSGKERFSFLRVMVAKKDLPAFKSLGTFKAPAEMVVYGKVLRDPDANFLFLQLLGRKATVDAAGNATVDW